MLAATWGKVDDRPRVYCLTPLLRFNVVVALQGVVKRGVRHQGGSRDSIPFRCPDTEVGKLAAFGTEGAPWVTFPGTGLVTERTSHVCIVPHRIRGSVSGQLGRNVLAGGTLQQSAEAALIDFREAEEFDAKLPALAPT